MITAPRSISESREPHKHTEPVESCEICSLLKSRKSPRLMWCKSCGHILTGTIRGRFTDSSATIEQYVTRCENCGAVFEFESDYMYNTTGKEND